MTYYVVGDPAHGTAPGWWLRGVWPKCKCGFAPTDNIALAEHYAGHGFREVFRDGVPERFTVSRNP